MFWRPKRQDKSLKHGKPRKSRISRYGGPSLLSRDEGTYGTAWAKSSPWPMPLHCLELPSCPWRAPRAPRAPMGVQTMVPKQNIFFKMDARPLFWPVISAFSMPGEGTSWNHPDLQNPGCQPFSRFFPSLLSRNRGYGTAWAKFSLWPMPLRSFELQSCPWRAPSQAWECPSTPPGWEETSWKETQGRDRATS